ncbi:hypothetical protein O7627_11635 [Solwaraspora sp. WMMD1047]|uniref:hypothetical protein n=1 Tax=Solwaraspora sp. WMMD1047 TaxID=3016102 RepID=UPI002417D21C|nr:hypothetical protein [Solwaraspora sp. WMMD1047]MDG4829951.1 hypothetical protein [Solwaraspora sp. WMMD1047]
MQLVDAVGYNPRAANVVSVLRGLGNCLIGTTGSWTQRLINRINNFQERSRANRGGYGSGRYRS